MNEDASAGMLFLLAHLTISGAYVACRILWVRERRRRGDRMAVFTFAAGLAPSAAVVTKAVPLTEPLAALLAITLTAAAFSALVVLTSAQIRAVDVSANRNIDP